MSFTTIWIKNKKNIEQPVQLTTTGTSATIGLGDNAGVLCWATGNVHEDSRKVFKSWGLDPKKVARLCREFIFNIIYDSVAKVNELAKEVLSNEEEKGLEGLIGELSWVYKSKHFPIDFQRLFINNLCGDLCEEYISRIILKP